MIEDPSKAAPQNMDRLLSAKSASSGPRQAASSAGASSPAIPANLASIDWCDSGKSLKGGFTSRSGARPPGTTAASASTGEGSTPGCSLPSCRPWDRGDLLKRLATFKSSTWYAKSKVAGPVACARRGWVNVDVDLIACEACGFYLTFPTPSSWSRKQVEIAAEAFGEQLDSGHKALCPWKGNSCAESLAQFPPTPISALIGGYDDRCDALLQLSALPVISGSAIDQMKLTRGLQIDWLLAQPPPIVGGENSKRVERGHGTESLKKVRVEATGNAYYQAHRLISLCGWEPRLLPYIVDIEEHSAHTARKTGSVTPSEGPSRRFCDPGPSMLLRSSEGTRERNASRQSSMIVPESKCEPPSAVLDCSLCGASVGLHSFLTVVRPSPFVGSTSAEAQGLGEKDREPMHGISAASGIDGWCAIPVKQKPGPEEAGDATTAEEGECPSHGRTLDLNLMIAGGPIPTLVGSSVAAPSSTEPVTDNPPTFGQPEGSEMSRRVASYESFGPVAGEYCLDDGGSTVDRPQSKLHCTDSIEDDDREAGGGRFYVGETSKRKRAGESLAADQFSYGLASTGPGPSNLLGDIEVEGTDRTKRNRLELFLQELNDQRIISVQSARGSLHASSVIAVDTSYSQQENSMESVDNFPDNSDAEGAAVSIEGGERADLEEISTIEQAQQSTCHQSDFVRVDDRSSEPGTSTSDEGGGGSLAVEINPVVGIGHGFSMGTSGGSVHMGASHEAEIHGTDMSVHQTESIGGDAELVTEVTENSRQKGEYVPDHTLIGEFVPEDVERTNAPDVLAASHEAVLSLSASKADIGTKHDRSAHAGSWESEEKDSPRVLGDQSTDTNQQAVILGGEAHRCTEATLVDRRLQKANSVAAGGEGRGSGDRRSWDHGGFNPIRQHRRFCPWVNGDVAAAATNDLSIAASLCGWQLTIDALDAVRMQERAPVAPVESESAASMHKICSPLIT